MIEETPITSEITSESDFNKKAEVFATLYASLDTPKLTLVQINESIDQKSV
jgi:hypothetical protein